MLSFSSPSLVFGAAPELFLLPLLVMPSCPLSGPALVVLLHVMLASCPSRRQRCELCSFTELLSLLPSAHCCGWVLFITAKSFVAYVVLVHVLCVVHCFSRTCVSLFFLHVVSVDKWSSTSLDSCREACVWRFFPMFMCHACNSVHSESFVPEVGVGQVTSPLHSWSTLCNCQREAAVVLRSPCNPKNEDDQALLASVRCCLQPLPGVGTLP